MRHRIKAEIIGSFAPKKQKSEFDRQLEEIETAENIEEIFDEYSNISNDAEALSALGFYDNPDAME